MTLTKRADISRMMYIGQREIFKKNLEKLKKEEWRNIVTEMPSDKAAETYDTIGNLKAAAVKDEGDPVVYGKIAQAHQTTVTNQTIANGFSVTLEAADDDQYNVIGAVEASELARTMITKREKEVADCYDGLFADTGADGVASIAATHPLINSDSVNDNLATGELGRDNIILAANKFNDIKNHAGDPFDTDPTALLVNKNNQWLAQEILQSSLVPHEQSNTKNMLPILKLIVNRYIEEAPWFLIDESIPGVIFQRRSGMKTEYFYDKKDTFNHYFNAHERYKVAKIHPGFGVVGSLGVAEEE